MRTGSGSGSGRRGRRILVWSGWLLLIAAVKLAQVEGEQVGERLRSSSDSKPDGQDDNLELLEAEDADELLLERRSPLRKRHTFDELDRPKGSASGPGQLKLQPASREQQPPNELVFSNQTGAIAHCSLAAELTEAILKAESSASAQPVPPPAGKGGLGAGGSALDIQVKWERENGEEIEATLYGSSSGDTEQQRALLRYVRLSDGALVFEPFRASDFRADVHASSYRCTASSGSRGASLVSRDVQVKAFVAGQASQQQQQQVVQIEVLDELVIAGNAAQFKCQIPFHAQDYLQVLDWLEYPSETLLTLHSTTQANANQLLRLAQRQEAPAGAHKLRRRQQAGSHNDSLVPFRYFVAPKTGDLHILNVDMSLNYRAFKCRCKNKLTGELLSSLNKGKLIVTESNSQIAPRLVMETSRQLVHLEGELAMLSCNLQAFPRAQIFWHRKLNEIESQPLELARMLPGGSGELKYAQVGGILLINKLHRNDSGVYLCQAKNSAGEERLETEVLVRAPLKAKLSASASVLELGKSLALDCSISGHPIHQVVFRHNQNVIKSISGAGGGALKASSSQRLVHHYSGRPAATPDGFSRRQEGFKYQEAGSYFVVDSSASSERSAASELELLVGGRLSNRSSQQEPHEEEEEQEMKLSHVIVIVLEPQHAGAYQCFAYNQYESVHSSAYIRVLDDPPKFKETFSSQVYEQLKDISLQCSARANPLPEITWSIDGQQIPESNRIRFGDFVTKDNLVISYVNISQTQVTDSGLYKCSADNGLAQISHQAQISVQGAIQVKPMGNVTVVASTSFKISCPVAGYPIQEIHWEHNGRRLPANHRQHVYENGTLEVEHMEKSAGDEGEYLCVASGGPPGRSESAFGSVEVSIRVRPTIEPFAISRLLREGQRASVMCTISSGDLPISISWFKDEQPLLPTSPASPFEPALQGANSNFPPAELLFQAGSGAPQVQAAAAGQELGRFGGPGGNGSAQLAGLRVSRVSDYSSTLLFESLSVQHSGNYTCLARNDAGSVSHQALMIVQVAPKWSIEPSDTNIVRGSASSIDCMATGFPPPRIIWTKASGGEQQKYVDSGGKSNHLGSWRPIVSSPHLQVFENGSLNVLDARDSDAGHYMCQASNGVGAGLSKVLKVTINVAAQFNTRHSIQYVTRGEQAHLKCQAKGDWPIAVHWFRNKNRLEPINLQDAPSSGLAQAGPQQQQQQSQSVSSLLASVIMIPSSYFPQPASLQTNQKLARGSSGSVMEQLSSLLLLPGSGSGQQQQQLEANSGPKQQPAGGLLLPKYSMAITEVVQGKLAASQLERRPFREQPRGSAPVLGQLSSVLSISQAERQDTGTFKCFAANHFGLDERTVQLVVQEPPERVEELSVLEVGSRSVSLGWLAPFDGNSPILNYHVQYRPAAYQLAGQQASLEALNSLSWFNITLAGSSGQPEGGAQQQPQEALATKRLQAANGRTLLKLAVGQLKPMTNYWFRLQAENKLGFGPVSSLLESLTMEEAPGAAPGKLKAVAQSSSSILVSWAKLSEKDSSGSVSGYYVAYKPLGSAQPAAGNSTPLAKSPAELDKSDDGSPGSQPPANIYKTVPHDDKITKFDALLTGLKRSTRYLISVQAYNARGTGPASEPVLVNTLEMDPPRQVKLYVRQASNCTIQLEWRPLSQAALAAQQQPLAAARDSPGGPPEAAAASKQQVELADLVDYYSLFQAELNERPRWQEVRLAGYQSSHLVEKLRCGTRYQFYMMGVNRIGVGDQSEILDTKTAGGLPLAPDRQATFDVINTTCYTIRLDHWHSNGCPISEFNIRFRPELPASVPGSRDWHHLAHLNLNANAAELEGSRQAKEQLPVPSSLDAAAEGLVSRLKRDQSEFYLYTGSEEGSDEDAFLEYSAGAAEDYAPEAAESELARGEQQNKQLLSLLKDSMLPTIEEQPAELTRLERSNYQEKRQPASRQDSWSPESGKPSSADGKANEDWQRVSFCNLIENVYYTLQMTAVNSVGETEAELRILTSAEGLEYNQEKKRQVVGPLGGERQAQSRTIFSERLSNALWFGSEQQQQFLLSLLLSMLILGSLLGFILLRRASRSHHTSGSHTSTTTSTTAGSGSSMSGSSNHCQNYLNESHAGHQGGPLGGYKGGRGPPSAITEALTFGNDCERYTLAGAGSLHGNHQQDASDGQPGYPKHQQQSSGFEEPAYGIVAPAASLFGAGQAKAPDTPLNGGSPTLPLTGSSTLGRHFSAPTSAGYQQHCATMSARGRNVYLCSAVGKDADQAALAKAELLPANATIFYNMPHGHFNQQFADEHQQLAKSLLVENYLAGGQQQPEAGLQAGEQASGFGASEPKPLEERFLSIVEEVARANESLGQQTAKLPDQCNQPECFGQPQQQHYHADYGLGAALSLEDSQKQAGEQAGTGNGAGLLFDPVYATISRSLPQAIRYLTLQQQHQQPRPQQQAFLCNGSQRHSLNEPDSSLSLVNRQNQQNNFLNNQQQQSQRHQQQVDLALFNSTNLAALNLLSSSGSGSLAQQSPGGNLNKDSQT